MKNLPSAMILFCALSIAAAPSIAAAAPKVNPADYTLTVHVSAAAYAPNVLFQILTVAVGGMHYQIQGGTSSSKVYSHGNGLLNPGDYPGKLTLDTHKTPFESIQQFEILLPDGTTRRFEVIAQSE